MMAKSNAQIVRAHAARNGARNPEANCLRHQFQRTCPQDPDTARKAREGGAKKPPSRVCLNLQGGHSHETTAENLKRRTR